MAKHESYVKQHLGKYRNKDLAKSAILSTVSAFTDLRPKYDTFVFSDNTRKDLLSLDGTIPVSFKGATYNIPICIWLFETHPFNPPICYVRPTQDMMIRTSKYVDAGGRVYLPYLHEWKHPNSDLIGLIQVMTIIFGENSPVYARPANQPPQMQPMSTPYHGSQPPPSQAPRPAYPQPMGGYPNQQMPMPTPNKPTPAGYPGSNQYRPPTNYPYPGSTPYQQGGMPTPQPPGSYPYPTTQAQYTTPDSQGMIVKSLRDNLLCPICLDLLEDAKSLPCQHVMCKECLLQWVASKGELRCPTCNTKHSSPAGGVQGLPSNFTMNSMVADMKKLETDDNLETGTIHQEPESSTTLAATASPTTTSPTNQLVDFSPGYTNWKKIPVAQTSFLEILGRQFKANGSTVKLKLQFCDVGGEPIPGESKADIEAIVEYPNGEKVQVSNVAINKRSGDFTVSFVAEKIGVHFVEVTLGGESVVGSPSKIVVRPNGKMDHTLNPNLHNPNGISALPSEIYITDGSCNVYITTYCDGTLLDYADTPDHREGTQLSTFGIATFNEKVFITDMENSCVYVYVGMECMNNFGKRVLETPTGITVSKNGTIFVADCESHTIDVFRPNYSHSHSIEVKGRGSLTHLALNQSEDNIIVADDKSNVIKIVDVHSAKMIKSIKTRVNQAPAIPFGVALDDDDNIYVSVTFDPAKLTKGNGAARHGDARRKGAVITYNSNGYFLGTIGEKELINPRGICFLDDPSPQLLVVEAGDSESRCQCIKVFRL